MDLYGKLIRSFLDEVSDIHEGMPRLTEYHQAYHKQVTQKQKDFDALRELNKEE